MTAALSNWQCARADAIGEHVERYRAGTLAAAEAALAAGAMLAEARAECPHGTWLPFLARAGLAERTAQNWMRLARSALDAANIVAAGGVRAALLALANPKAIAIVERQADVAAAEADEAISATVADLPEPAGTPAEPSSPAISGPRDAPVRLGNLDAQVNNGRTDIGNLDAQVNNGRTDIGNLDAQVNNAGAPAPARGLTLYQRRRAAGQCTSCGAPADGKARCDGCAGRLNRTRRSRTRIAGELATAIAAAAASGDGLTLTPADVARLAGLEPLPERCADTIDWIGGPAADA